MKATINSSGLFGLTTEEIGAMQNVFSNFEEVEKVIVYGSRAKGNHRPYSDIDMTLVGQNISDNTVTDIEFALDDLLMPYKIDLSIFSKINNGDLITEIKGFGKGLYLKVKPAKSIETWSS